MQEKDYNIDLKVTDEKAYNIHMIEFIKEIVAAYYKQPYDIYQDRSRKDFVIQVRYAAIYFINKNINITCAELGRSFRYHHATILHVINKLENHLSWDKQLQKEFEDIHKLITYKGMVSTSNVNLERDYYFINIDKFTSVRTNSHKAILFIGYEPDEIKHFQNMHHPLRGIEQKKHENLGWYVLNKKTNDTDGTQN